MSNLVTMDDNSEGKNTLGRYQPLRCVRMRNRNGIDEKQQQQVVSHNKRRILGRNRMNNQGNFGTSNSNQKIVGLQKLSEWSRYDESKCDELLFQLIAWKNPLKSLLSVKSLEIEKVTLLLKIFKVVTKSRIMQNKLQLIAILRGSHFLTTHIRQYLVICAPGESDKVKNDIMECLIVIMNEFLKLFPSSCDDVPIDAFKTFLIECKETKFDDEIEQLMGKRKALLMKKFYQNQNKSEKAQEVQPTDNFRNIEAILTIEEIHQNQNKPFLRKNKREGKFDDGKHYLDVQYRLLREDLVQPLREGIQEIFSGASNDQPKQNIKLYHNIEIKYPQCTKNGLIYRISFDTSYTQTIPWKYSRRLLFGSLLCFTKDTFRTVVFATVANRDPNDLSEGFIDVKFVNNIDFEYFKSNQKVTMVESNTYFEAYRYVLEAIKKFNGDAIPMSRYLVDCITEINIPAYLSKSATYNLKDSLNIEGDDLATFDVLAENKWPSYEDTYLNDSQLKAFKHAITKEFAVIQGPPGTGKTHIGLKIAHCLLKNKACRNESPLLIVCYTNHALDQFLQGLIALGHEKIIRIGGRCCEELKKYSKKKVAEEIISCGSLYKEFLNKERPKIAQCYDRIKDIRRAKHSPYSERESLSKEIEKIFENTKILAETIKKGKLISFNILQHFMSDRHSYYFKKYDSKCDELRLNMFEVFLQLFPIQCDDIYQIRESDLKKNTETNYDEEIANGEVDPNINVQGEGDVLMERWVIDDSQFKPMLSKENHLREKHTLSVKEEDKTFIDSDGFTYVKPSNKKMAKAFRVNFNKHTAMTKDQVRLIDNPWKLDNKSRWKLYKYWIEEFSRVDNEKVNKYIERFEDACTEVAELDKQEDAVVLENVDIIAMTTSGAARLQDMLQKLKPKIVIVEEAAEVLEGHVLASLSTDLEHLILIGDHKQLKPNPSVYNLAKKYNLDVSLFERMTNNGMECHTLDTQHRMRPEISSFLQSIYPTLKDHHSVMSYPPIKGITTNVMFINHQENESNLEHLKSKSNRHEATFLVALCLYLLRQGYQSNQITILSLYAGQIIELKNLMPKELFEGVRVTTVDNFQGEENDIVLLSLVRSNTDGKIGFLGIENRICVSLSRAKEGLYVIGNFDLLIENSSLWKRIVQHAKEEGYFGDSLTLQCQNHSEELITVKTAIDFRNSPEGGCQRPCSYRLKCNHACAKLCHPIDIDHKQYNCKKKCLKKTCDLGHHCDRKCHFGSDCGKCITNVSKVIPKCNHLQNIECHKDPFFEKCLSKCEKYLSCGHKCKGLCHENCMNLRCESLVSKILNCGHTQDVPCSEDINETKCKQKCK